MNELQTLAEQIRDLDGFRWLPGMVDTDGDRVLAVTGQRIELFGTDCGAHFCGASSMSAPDLTDPLTVEALVVLMRERDTMVRGIKYLDGSALVVGGRGDSWYAKDYALAVARAAVEVLR